MVRTTPAKSDFARSRKKKSSKKSSSKKSSSKSSRSTLTATAVSIKTGEKKFLVGGKLVDKPRKSKSSSKKRSIPTTGKVKSAGVATVVDPTKGTVTKTTFDANGKKRVSQRKLTPFERIDLSKRQLKRQQLKVTETKPSEKLTQRELLTQRVQQQVLQQRREDSQKIERQLNQRATLSLQQLKTSKNIKDLNNVESFYKELNERGAKLKDFVDFGSEFAKGAKTSIKETILLPAKVLRGAFNYGRSLRTRFERGENNPLLKDVKKIQDGSVSVAKFVAKNPVKSAAIAGALVSSVAAGAGKKFLENPGFATGFILAELAGGKIIIKGVQKGIRGVSKLSPKFVKEVEGIYKIKKDGLFEKETIYKF